MDDPHVFFKWMNVLIILRCRPIWFGRNLFGSTVFRNKLYSSLPAGKCGYVRPVFWWPPFPYTWTMTWLPKAESVWLEHSHSAPTLPLPKNEKEIKIKFSFVLLSRLNDQLTDEGFILFQPVSIASYGYNQSLSGSCLFPKANIPLCYDLQGAQGWS